MSHKEVHSNFYFHTKFDDPHNHWWQWHSHLTISYDQYVSI